MLLWGRLALESKPSRSGYSWGDSIYKQIWLIVLNIVLTFFVIIEQINAIECPGVPYGQRCTDGRQSSIEWATLQQH